MGKQAKCCVCTKGFQNVDIIKFKRKNYCYDCFEQSYPQDVVEQHYFYLHFQEVIGRPPTQVEWIQLKKMIEDSKSSNNKWDWWYLDRLLTYAYEIEKIQPNEEYGVVGIFPYMEFKAMKFFKTYDEAYDHNVKFEIENEVVEIYASNQRRIALKQKERVFLDDIVNDETLID